MASVPMASSSSSSSRTLLRHRYDPSSDSAADAISAGAYLARPPSARRDGRGKDKPRQTLIPGYPIGSRGWVKEGFRLFGEHCARNQIRTLLIDCLVMTNLFYPALSIYLQKRFPPLHPPAPPSHTVHRGLPHADHAEFVRRKRKEHPLSLLSTPVLDSFFPYPPPLLPRLSWGGWWTDTGQADWISSRVRGEETGDEIRVVRVGWADVGEVLDGADDEEEGTRIWTERDFGVMNLVRRTVEGWQDGYRDSGEECVRELQEGGGDVSLTGGCYLLSPDRIPDATLLSDLTNSNGSVTSHLASKDEGQAYRSLAAVFRVPESSRTTFDGRWLEAMELVAQQVDAEVFVEALRPHMSSADQKQSFDISYHPAKPKDETTVDAQSDDKTPKSVLFLYLVLFTILGSQLSNATKVHSRFGLAFTGIVQLCCSAVMSFSVLALLGWNGWGWNSGVETSLPTYVLPFVVVVVGAENMSTLTKAVFSVPFSHSVPARIGLGLSKVGTTIALTSLTDLVLLLGIWLCVNLRPVREFCLFAAVVIITDWFMLHTFFLTVLSIDAQRLELADVLASNGGVIEAPTLSKEESSPQHSSDSGWRKMIKARTSKSGSLLFILISVGVIYYLTERHRLPLSTPNLYGYTPTISIHPSTPPTPFTTLLAEFPELSTAERFWRSLNPSGLSRVRTVIPLASIIVLPRLGHTMRPADLRKLSLPTSRIVLPRLKPLFYLFKVVVLPQAVTAGTLYIILLYLLKDSELLDAQRHRLGRNEIPRDSDDEDVHVGRSRGMRGVQVHVLPCSHDTDIDFIASSDDGMVLVSVGIDNSLYLWRFTESPGSGTREALKTDQLGRDDTVTCAAVSPDGKTIFVMTNEGVLHQWNLDGEDPPISRGSHDSEIKGATEMKLSEALNKSDDPFLIRPASPAATETTYNLLVMTSQASVISVSLVTMEKTIIVPASAYGSRAMFLSSDSTSGGSLAILILRQTEATIYRQVNLEWFKTIIETAAEDKVSVGNLTASNLVLGYRSGSVEVFDITGSPIIAVGGVSTSTSSHTTTLEGVVRIDMVTPASSSCITCGMISSDSTFIISSTSDRVLVDRLNSRGNIPCRCRRSSVLDETKYPTASGNESPARLAIPPTAYRGGYSPGASPKRSPGLLPPVSNGAFPLSSHGTRRLSALHRDDGNSPHIGIGAMTTTTSSPESDMEVLPLGAILAPGGGLTWSVSGDLLLGLRRVGAGIDDAQWELWAVDLRAPWNGSSLVVDAAPLTSLLQKGATIPSASVRAQRTERLLSMSGRAPFPSLGASFSVETFAPMAYTEIRPFHPVFSNLNRTVGTNKSTEHKAKIVIGLGNRMGIVSVPEGKQLRHQSSSTQVSNMGSGIGLASMGSGVTPPPPSTRREVGLDKKVL